MSNSNRRLSLIQFFSLTKQQTYLHNTHTNVVTGKHKRQRIPKGLSKMDDIKKLATLGTQEEEKQRKNTTQYALDTAIRKQTQIT